MFKDFRDRGFCVIPLRGGVPLVEWSRFFNEMPELGEVENWTGNEYALVCGKVSNIVALDIDTDEPEGLRAYQLAGETPVRKRGSKGFTAFYRYNGEQSTNWKRKGDKSPLVELLCNKRLTTIPPSPHRVTGEIYEWMDGKGLGDIELPELSADFVTLMNALYPKPQRHVPVVPYTPNALDEYSLSDIEDMLDHITSDCTRDEWINIGMSLRDEFGDAACSLFHRWSAKAASRYNHSDCQAAWRSFTGEGVTIGTIVHLAKKGGWLPVRDKEAEAFTVDLEYIYALRKNKGKKKELKVNGLVGEIAEWITSTAIRPQPVLSLAAALSFVAMLQGHRIKGYTNLRTNLLLMSLAPTSAGKEHPQSCIKRLISACGLDEQLMGEPTSGTGFLRAVNERGRVALMVMDEIGRYIGNASGKQAGSFQREIIDYIIKTFSCANSVLKGREYADSKKNPTIDIKQPHFVCLGSTVEERLKSACSSSEIVDGFLNRWIVMAVKDRGVRQKKVKFTPPPQSIIDKVLAMSPREYDGYTGDPILKKVKFTSEAWEVFDSFRDEMDSMIDDAPYPLNALYARTAEHVEKIALTICDGGDIMLQDVNSAIAIMEYSNECIMGFANLISDNETEEEYIKVREIIKDAGLIDKSSLTRQTQFIRNGARRRTEILTDLVESGEVEVVKEGKATFLKFLSSK